MNYRRIYNQVYDVQDISGESVEIIEPVTLEEMKNFMRLEGFEDDNESGEIDFTSDDELIEELITAARAGLEKWCGISIVDHRWQVRFTNLAGYIELPFSNGYSIVSLVDCNDTTIASSDYKFRGIGTLSLDYPRQRNMIVVYDAGMEEVPKRLKQAIMRDVLYHYENRGEAGLSEHAMGLASGFKKVSTWLA